MVFHIIGIFENVMFYSVEESPNWNTKLDDIRDKSGITYKKHPLNVSNQMDD